MLKIDFTQEEIDKLHSLWMISLSSSISTEKDGSSVYKKSGYKA